MKGMNSKLKKKRKLALYQAQKGRCQYCGNAFLLHELTFDHVIRKKDGGGNNIENLVLACSFCNTYRELEHASDELKQRFLRHHTHFIHTHNKYPIPARSFRALDKMKGK